MKMNVLIHLKYQNKRGVWNDIFLSRYIWISPWEMTKIVSKRRIKGKVVFFFRIEHIVRLCLVHIFNSNK